MTKSLEDFLAQIPQVDSLEPADLVDWFAYYLTVDNGREAATSGEIADCFKRAKIAPYSHIPQYLSRNTVTKKGNKAAFVKAARGYNLERARKNEMARYLKVEPIKRETSNVLRGLPDKLSLTDEREFLNEVIDCFEIGANRAAIVLVWILTMDHLYDYVLAIGLDAFNQELAKVTDKRVKVKEVTKKDDFPDIFEAKFIELCRAANLISNDVRKILSQKLETRNSSAHPSGVKISQLKAAEFIQDLVSNVLLKYPL